MQHLYRAAALAAAFLAATQAAQAQGFLKRLAERAVSHAESEAEQKVRQGVTSAVDGTGRKRAHNPEAAPEGNAGASDAGGNGQPAPAPAAAKAVRYVGDIAVPADVEAQKTRYNKFGEVSCNDCEGGIELDGRPKFEFDEFSGKYNERAMRVGTWTVGQSLRWQGRASVGTLTLLREETVDGFRCRRLEYRLVRGKASASRPSLICWGLASSASSVENWHEVY
ncbi:hypothetical protein [Sphingomonas sp. NIBR02145]|uniref:hypothetical protein n=1 Tax=Sphingomonas sp. NIBR02145 TaxID=3014784 RepID=UPI0022B4FB73|nr:hypothetical protein [Sphingomonas sp. NIBR02145]WHU01951.1 hypothetical protein O3305_17400 [Sphingomonas sp. NIBR02145]